RFSRGPKPFQPVLSKNFHPGEILTLECRCTFWHRLIAGLAGKERGQNMRKTRAVFMIASAALTALLAACGPASSLNPLFTERNSIFDDRLVGDWCEKGPDNATLRFEQAGPSAYRLTNLETDREGGRATETPYEAHLVGLGAYRFLDVAPLQMTAASDYQDLDPARSGDVSEPRLLQIGEGYYIETPGGSSGYSHEQGEVRLRR